MKVLYRTPSLGVALFVLFAGPNAIGQGPASGGAPFLRPEWVRPLTWRSIGPSVMVGRVVDVAVVESEPSTFYVGTATGGVWKTVNAGTTFEPLFQQQGSISIGDVAVAPSDPSVLWVGTGENNARNSVSWGDGVYKSTDSGKTWSHMGLRDSFQIGRLAIHPKDPNTVLVGALGRLWGPGGERGLYRTTDGGKSWTRTLYVNESTGIIDVEFDPKNPNIVLAATYERARDLFDSIPNYDPSVKWSASSGLWRSTDGGKTFARVTKGLPTVRMGRIGLDFHLKDPRIVYAIVESELVGANAEQIQKALAGPPSTAQTYTEQREFSASYQGQAENVQDKQGPNGFETGGVFKSTDGGVSWNRVNSITQRPFYYSIVRVDPSNPDTIYLPGLQFMRSDDGGKTFDNSPSRGPHSDHHTCWIDPANSKHLVLGNDGGVYQSWDRGATWLFHNNIAASQIYHVAVDTNRPYNIYAGFQDNGSWGGPSRKKNGRGNLNQDWIRVGGGDGFVCLVDPNDPDLVYVESQDGSMSRLNIRTGERASIRPAAIEGEKVRFLWDTPMALSNHNSRIFYCAGNYVYRSLDRGNDLRKISPEITRTDRGSASAFAESPRDPQVLWVGSDDGYLWVTRDGGTSWKRVTPSMDTACYVSRIEASRFADGRAYVAFDGHRSDVDGPLLFATDDFGATWRSLNANLPSGSTRVIREDPENENLLFVGTEFFVFASLNRGEEWTALQNNLPTGAVHDLLVHPDGELIAGTHGRGIWIAEISPLRQIVDKVRSSDAFLFQPAAATIWGYAGPSRGDTGGGLSWEADTVPGASIFYSLASKTEGVVVRILDAEKKTVVEIKGGGDAGVNRVDWDLSRPRPQSEQTQGQRRRGPQTVPVAPGVYTVVLVVGGKEYTQSLDVIGDPG